MSLVTQSCDRLLTCIQNDFPWDAERFQAGLSLEEIKQKVKELPFSLPEEVYEFYQWRNGNPSGNFLIPGKLAGCLSYFWFMMSLDEAVNTYFLRGDISSRPHKDGGYITWNSHYFPLFESLHEGLFQVIEIGKETSSIFLFDPSEGEFERLCDNFTEFLKIEADFFEEQSKEKS